MKLLVIGNPKAVLGFSLIGVSGWVATTADEVNLALDNALVDKDLGIVLVTEDVVALIDTRMDELKLRSSEPLVVEIPAPEVNGERIGRPSLSEIVFRAIGVKI
jgi:V/A-type H+/Na+-transporting ATPase subunit F